MNVQKVVKEFTGRERSQEIHGVRLIDRILHTLECIL